MVSDSPDRRAIARAVETLRSGGVVALPTDTVYGIGAIASNRDATAMLFALKSRSRDASLPVLVAGVASARPLVVDPDGALERLAEVFWPGPLTVVMRRREGVDFALGGDPDTIGIRCPANELTRGVLAQAGPLAVTSANRSGEPPATTAAAVEALFGDRVVVVDGGICDAPTSTVISLVGSVPELLRAGPIDREAVLTVLGLR
jgi:tRNA threonylcarbamoyl adenosine modification protein (Sua5/YciO/YrdC/YwlC family)